MIHKPKKVEIWNRLKENLYFDSSIPKIIFVNSIEEVNKEPEKYFKEINEVSTIKIKKRSLAPAKEIEIKSYIPPIMGYSVCISWPNMKNKELWELHLLYNRGEISEKKILGKKFKEPIFCSQVILISEEGVQQQKKWLKNYKKIDDEFARFLLLTHELSEAAFLMAYPNYSYVIDEKLDRAMGTWNQTLEVTDLIQKIFDAYVVKSYEHSLIVYLQSNLLDSFNYKGKEIVMKMKESIVWDAINKLKRYKSVANVKRNYDEYFDKFLYLTGHLYENDKLNKLFKNSVSLNTIKPILDKEVKKTKWFYTPTEIKKMQKRWDPELARMGLKFLVYPI